MQVTLNILTKDLGGNGVPLTPIAPTLSMFTSARLFLGGQVLEQIDELGPLATIIERLKPKERRIIYSMQTHPQGITR